MTLALAEEFLREGYRVDVVLAQARGELLDEVVGAIKVIDLKAKRLRNVLRPLRTYLRRERPDALLAAMWPLTAIAVVAARFARTGTKVVVSEHTMLSMTQQASGVSGLMLRVGYRFVVPRADSVVAVSRGVADDLVSLGLDQGRAVVVNNPISQQNGGENVPAELLEWWSAEGSLRLLAVGALKAAKDFYTLIEGLSHVLERRPARLIILGEGALRDSLSDFSKAKGVDQFVRMPGYAERTAPYYHAADLFVFSSVFEGMGNVLVEALSAGTPVVSTDCRSGPAEILGDGKYGMLVPVGDPVALSKAILSREAWVTDPSLLRTRSRDFSPDRIAKRYLELLFPMASSKDSNQRGGADRG